MTITQNEANAKQTYLEGRALGEYDAYIDGQHITTLFANSYPEALTQFHQLLDEHRTERPTPDWYFCDGCGKSVDEGDDCPECKAPSWAGGILWVTPKGRRFLEPVAPMAPVDCLEDADILVNDEWWLTQGLPMTAVAGQPVYAEYGLSGQEVS